MIKCKERVASQRLYWLIILQTADYDSLYNTITLPYTLHYCYIVLVLQITDLHTMVHYTLPLPQTLHDWCVVLVLQTANHGRHHSCPNKGMSGPGQPLNRSHDILLRTLSHYTSGTTHPDRVSNTCFGVNKYRGLQTPTESTTLASDIGLLNIWDYTH